MLLKCSVTNDPDSQALGYKRSVPSGAQGICPPPAESRHEETS